MIALSTMLKARLLTDSGLQQQLVGGRILLFASARPSSPDQAQGLSPVAQITQNGVEWPGAGGLQLVLSATTLKLERQGTWIIKGLATGTPVWWRFCGPADDPGQFSVTHVRVDGDMPADLYLPEAHRTMYLGYARALHKFTVGFPT